MPDITLFEVDLSGTKFVAPFGHYHEGEAYHEDDDEGGRNWKLLGGLVVVGLAALGGVAFVLKRKLGGGDDKDEDREAGEFEAEGRFGFDEEFDIDAENEDGDEEYEFDRESTDDSSRKGAVAAVVGLLFLILVTAIVKRRGSESKDATDIEVEAADTGATAERER
ncbi:hypothetical protein [Halomarina litorea]|uniref:hypothetical protein n=1 Tax=Halomarina litorea TaxID=2961595 RepID=UPI0020C582AE|nr:hypothetical protein [Halomarina sp. BCD28]